MTNRDRKQSAIKATATLLYDLTDYRSIVRSPYGPCKGKGNGIKNTLTPLVVTS